MAPRWYLTTRSSCTTRRRVRLASSPSIVAITALRRSILKYERSGMEPSLGGTAGEAATVRRLLFGQPRSGATELFGMRIDPRNPKPGGAVRLGPLLRSQCAGSRRQQSLACYRVRDRPHPRVGGLPRATVSARYPAA